jgi:hypothetical protein
LCLYPRMLVVMPSRGTSEQTHPDRYGRRRTPGIAGGLPEVRRPWLVSDDFPRWQVIDGQGRLAT